MGCFVLFHVKLPCLKFSSRFGARFAHGVMWTVSLRRWGCHCARFRRRTKQKDVAVLDLQNHPRKFVTVLEQFLWLEGLLHMARSVWRFLFRAWLPCYSWLKTCAPAPNRTLQRSKGVVVSPLYHQWSEGCNVMVRFPRLVSHSHKWVFRKHLSWIQKNFGFCQTTTESSRAALMFANWKCLHPASASAFSEGVVALCRPPRSLVSWVVDTENVLTLLDMILKPYGWQEHTSPEVGRLRKLNVRGWKRVAWCWHW